MLSKDKVQAWTNLPKPLKARLENLKQVDPVLYSESRVIWQCVEAHLAKVEAVALPSFIEPTQETPSRRRRLPR